MKSPTLKNCQKQNCPHAAALCAYALLCVWLHSCSHPVCSVSRNRGTHTPPHLPGRYKHLLITFSKLTGSRVVARGGGSANRSTYWSLERPNTDDTLSHPCLENSISHWFSDHKWDQNSGHFDSRTWLLMMVSVNLIGSFLRKGLS